MYKSFLVFVFVIGWGLLPKSSLSQEQSFLSSNTLVSADFILNTLDQSTEETITGDFQYYNGDLLIEVAEPIRQNILITGTSMIIYYPKENSVIEFFGKTPFDLPIISSILPVFKKDYGLSDIGFILDDFSISGDTTLSTWIPREITDQNQDSKFKLLFVQDQLAWVQHSSIANQLDIVTQLNDYIEVDGNSIPTIINTVKKINGKEVIETISMSQLETQSNATLELTLTIPDDAKKQQYSF